MVSNDVTIMPLSVVPIICMLHNFIGHQETIHTFMAIRRSYWWPKLHKDVVQYINKCEICAKDLPNMAKYPQKYLQIPQIPMEVLAIDTIDYLRDTSKENRWALTVI